MKVVWFALMVFFRGSIAIEECPETHPFAFENGKSCCKYGTFGDFFYELDYDDDGSCCFSKNGTCCLNNESIKCPKGQNCQDFRTQCILLNEAKTTVQWISFIAEGFAENYNGQYYFDETQPIFVNGKPLYIKEKECLWYGTDKHWWMGDCNLNGQNEGYAYLEPDMGCPYLPCNNLDSFWKLKETDEYIIDAYTEYEEIVPVVAASEVSFLSSTGKISSNLSYSAYKRKCQFVYIKRLRGYRCISLPTERIRAK